jgi:hypothetical protein
MFLSREKEARKYLYKTIPFPTFFPKKNLVYTWRYMETKQPQEQAPHLSIVEQKKMEAGKFVADKIDTLMQDNAELSLLNAARQVYEEVKGQNYREEQASAKLLEYLTMQNEVDLRKGEILETYQALSSVISGKNTSTSSANDDKYLVAA